MTRITLMKNEAYIRGIGKYLPEKVLTSAELEKRLNLESGWIESKTGVAERRIAAEGDAVSDLATRAARNILANAGARADEVDLIIVATSMPDMFFPSTAGAVQAQLGIAGVPAFDLLNACAGFLYGVSTATAFVEAGEYRNILVIGAETTSRMVDWDDRKTCILFGDAAAGFLVSCEGDRRILGRHLGADGAKGHVLSIRGGGAKAPCSREILDAKLHKLYMEGGEVFRFAMVALGEAIKKAAEKTGCALGEIGLIVPHQSNVRIIEEAAKLLNLPLDRFFTNIRERGNTAAASVPLAVTEAVESGRLAPGTRLAMSSYGAGLSWAACVVDW